MALAQPHGNIVTASPSAEAAAEAQLEGSAGESVDLLNSGIETTWF